MAPAGPKPLVSVLVPSKNDPRIVQTLAGLRAQASDRPFEILVIDSSDPPIRPHIERVVREGGGTYVFAEANVAQALRLGVERARGSIVITLPADAEPTKGWLNALVRPLVAGEAAWAAGPAIGKRIHRTPVWYYFETRTASLYRGLESAAELPAALPGWNTAYLRAAVLKAGNFDPDLTSSEDWDLHLRLVAAGFKGVFVADAAILHEHPFGVAQLFRRERWYKRGQLRVARKHGRRTGWVELSTPVTYAMLLALVPLAFLHRWVLYGTSVLWGLLALRQVGLGLAQRDPYFLLRPVLRLVEGVAGILAVVEEFRARRP